MPLITRVWSRISSVRWEDVWIERLQFAGVESLVIKKFPASRSIRLDLCTDAITAMRLRKAFGGTIRIFNASAWRPTTPKITDPLRIGGKLRIYRDKILFKKEKAIGRGAPLLIPTGMAFGTGDHATTARCLQLLVEAAGKSLGSLKNWSLLDLGCGSGILSLSAELLGARKILGVDFDQNCVRISKENAVLNRLSCARFVKADVLHWKTSGSYDIVVANLYSTILTAASEMIVKAVAPGGILIFSGILTVEIGSILDMFAKFDLNHVKTLKRGKWGAVMLRKGHKIT